MAVDVQVVERPAVAADEAARPDKAAPPRPRVRWFAPRREIPDRAYGLLAAASFVAAFLFWTWASHQSFANPVFLPPPEKVWDGGARLPQRRRPVDRRADQLHARDRRLPALGGARAFRSAC